MKILAQNILIILCFSLFSCKTDSIDNTETPLTFAVHSLLMYEGDSIQLSFTDPSIVISTVLFSASVGTVNSSGLYIAPAHIEQDTVHAIVTCTFNSRQTQTTFLITKKAFKQSLVSYNQTIQPLLNSNCNFSGCHGNGSHGGKVELSTYDSTYKNIIPYNAPASKLYNSITTTDPLLSMPPAGKLHDDKIQAIGLWIEQGALRN